VEVINHHPHHLLQATPHLEAPVQLTPKVSVPLEELEEELQIFPQDLHLLLEEELAKSLNLLQETTKSLVLHQPPLSRVNTSYGSLLTVVKPKS